MNKQTSETKISKDNVSPIKNDQHQGGDMANCK